jgi:hypothetical protein
MGWTQSDLSHARRLGVLRDLNMTAEYVDELLKRSERLKKPLSRALVLHALRQGTLSPDGD